MFAFLGLGCLTQDFSLNELLTNLWSGWILNMKLHFSTMLKIPKHCALVEQHSLVKEDYNAPTFNLYIWLNLLVMISKLLILYPHANTLASTSPQPRCWTAIAETQTCYSPVISILINNQSGYITNMLIYELFYPYIVSGV